MVNQNCKVIVFDLDGTLYEDTHHFEYYAKRLQLKLPNAKQDKFWGDYQSALGGNHALKIGRCYDVRRKFLLVQEHNLVKQAFSWEGVEQNSAVSEYYQKPIVIDMLNVISIGDLWWLPATVARHHDLSVKDTYQAFLETRSYMMGPDFFMTRAPGFAEALSALRTNGLKLVLLTNSPEPDSEVILKKLGLETLFDLKIFEGQKPTHTAQRFRQIKDHYQVEYSDIISIGDNWLNEILPATELGCETILIDPYYVSKNNFADYVVRDLSQLIPLLAKLNHV